LRNVAGGDYFNSTGAATLGAVRWWRRRQKVQPGHKPPLRLSVVFLPRKPAHLLPQAICIKPMNPFDAVVYAIALIAIVMGFKAGLLRSLATILGYLIAAPIAVAVTPAVTAVVTGQHAMTPEKTWFSLCVVFVVIGIAVSALLRYAVNEFIGPDVSLFDRFAGALLGAARIGLVAVLIVLIFDRIIPADRQPPFLADSRLRPYLSAAGQKGLRSLPPDIEAYIERLKQQRGV
jgi:membrane protein required for colicin V production